MSYPPPNADQYALNGAKFFRLNTPLVSDGDVYESAQGAQAFAIGPDSDISKVNIAYYDDQVPNFVNQFAITPERSFPGLVPARNEVNYVPSNRPGRILIWSDELYNPTFSPFAIDAAARTDFEVPVMDVIQYFAPSGLATNQGRNDKEYWYDFLAAPTAPDGVTNGWSVIIPFYGRRFATMTFISDATAQLGKIDVSILGLHYKPGDASNAAIKTPLIDDGLAHGSFRFVTVDAGESFTTTILASNRTSSGAVFQGENFVRNTNQVCAGMFDALAFTFNSQGTGAGAINRAAQNTLRIRTSDRENG